MEIIKVSNLHTAFGDNIVHNDISFNVNENEIFGVLGGSGSGKSVLVNLRLCSLQDSLNRLKEHKKNLTRC